MQDRDGVTVIKEHVLTERQIKEYGLQEAAREDGPSMEEIQARRRRHGTQG